MLNTGGKIRKTKNTFEACFPTASMDDSDHQSTESAALIGSNDDLITEILLRLPAISIIRFRSVSKHWGSLLSHRHFTFRYDSLSKAPGIFFRNVYVPFDVENRSTPTPFRSLDFCNDSYGIRIIQSCNGLLLCCSDTCYNGFRKYYVFNPTTKQFAVIPFVPGVRKTVRFMGLAFHQTDCVHFKIVCIRRIELDGKSFQILIYSSVTRTWKISVKSFNANYPTFDKGGVYWNGAIHWAPSYESHLYFKIDVERLQMLPLPVEMTSRRTYTEYFGESRGHLHLIVTKNGHEHNRLHVNVYEMLSDHSGWFVKYQVDLDHLTGVFPKMVKSWGYSYDVIDVVRGDKEEDTFMVMDVSGKMIRYNVHDNSVNKIFNLSEYYDEGFPLFNRYIETLSSF